MILVVVVCSMAAVFFLIRPFKRLLASFERVSYGDLDTDIMEDAYKETIQLSQAVQKSLRKLKAVDQSRQEFVSNVSHELKTPMTIISADADLAEMECGENQWLTDIRRQARRLTELTNDLVYLSRMEEEQPKLQCIEFPISDVAEERADSFQAPAKSQEKDFSLSIQPMLSFTGDEKNIRKLISILLDNALKYSPRGGKIELRLEKQGFV